MLQEDAQDLLFKCHEEDELLQDDDFVLYQVKIIDCTKAFPHDYTACPWLHPGEKARRRDPRLYKYNSTLCPEVKKGKVCSRGESCPHSNNLFEYFLHPDRYRTKMCTFGLNCPRKLCFFAHNPTQLRTPTKCNNVCRASSGSSSSNTTAATTTSSSSCSCSSACGQGGASESSSHSAAVPDSCVQQGKGVLVAPAPTGTPASAGTCTAAVAGGSRQTLPLTAVHKLLQQLMADQAASGCLTTSPLLQQLIQISSTDDDSTAAAIMHLLDIAEDHKAGGASQTCTPAARKACKGSAQQQQQQQRGKGAPRMPQAAANEWYCMPFAAAQAQAPASGCIAASASPTSDCQLWGWNSVGSDAFMQQLSMPAASAAATAAPATAAASSHADVAAMHAALSGMSSLSHGQLLLAEGSFPGLMLSSVNNSACGHSSSTTAVSNGACTGTLSPEVTWQRQQQQGRIGAAAHAAPFGLLQASSNNAATSSSTLASTWTCSTNNNLGLLTFPSTSTTSSMSTTASDPPHPMLLQMAQQQQQQQLQCMPVSAGFSNPAVPVDHFRPIAALAAGSEASGVLALGAGLQYSMPALQQQQQQEILAPFNQGLLGPVSVLSSTGTSYASGCLVDLTYAATPGPAAVLPSAAPSATPHQRLAAWQGEAALDTSAAAAAAAAGYPFAFGSGAPPVSGAAGGGGGVGGGALGGAGGPVLGLTDVMMPTRPDMPGVLQPFRGSSLSGVGPGPVAGLMVNLG